MTYHRQANYCDTCYSAASKAGRTVRAVTIGGNEWEVCTLCESRIRNGLIHYVPSNGTEGHAFLGRCERCRHFDPDTLQDASVKGCAWGIADKILTMMYAESDSPNAWHDPADLTPTCPATCLRFTSKDDPHGEHRDPPPPDVPGQLTFGELPEFTPVERAIEREPTQS